MLEFQKVEIIRGGGSCALSLKSAFISLFAVNALTASVALCAQTASDMETFDYRVPYKLGLPIIAPSGTPGAFDQLAVDHPRLFVHDGRFYLSYLGYDGISYQTALAVSDDLLHWERVGMVFTRNQSTNNWDRLGRVVSSYLTPCNFRKNPELMQYKGRYWLFYHAYPGKGYEVGPPANGLAWADSPVSLEWHCLDKPVFTANPKEGHWDSGGVYSIYAVPFQGVFRLYYNGKEKPARGRLWHEQMGIADPTDDSLAHWQRRPGGPVIPAGDFPWNANFTSGAPLYDSRCGRWMRYFMGYSESIRRAYTGVGVSEDAITWRHSPIPVLSPGEKGEIDSIHAHKTAHAWLNGDLYIIYCSVRPLKDATERARFSGKSWNEYRCLTIARNRPWTEAERASLK